MIPHILIADDDVDIAMLISDSLTDEGYKVTFVHHGDDVIKVIRETGDISLVILDIMMPGMDGLSVCRKIRDSFKKPIIFVSAKSRTLDTLLGLEMGGDDYIPKPFVVEELVARVKAHLRREFRTSSETSHSVIQVGELTIYRDSFEVLKNGQRMEVSTREFQLLCFLADHIDKVLSREQIFDAVWGTDFTDIGTVTVHIKNLRDKIDPDSRYIKTVWGVGYKFIRPAGEV